MSSFADTLKGLGPARLAILGGTFFGLLIFFIFVSSQVSQPNMSILYSDLTTEDSSDISGKLQESGINFNVSADGSRVYVPQTDIGRARMLLAEAGLPNGGSMGYEIFDKQSGFGTTSFVQNINQVRALQGELGKTISAIEQVQYAKVHIVLPQRELFSRDSRPASASVTLKLKGAARLGTQQIYGIQNLVANAVPGLNAQNVTIIDTEANLLARGTEDDEGAMVGLKAEELRRSFEKRMVDAVEDLVGRTVGLNKVRAHVTADLNFDRISTSSEIYDPEGQVIRSTQSVSEDNVEREPPSSDGVSVDDNLPGLGANFDVNAEPSLQSNRTEEVTNFEISKTVRSTVSESGEVQRLSVAVLVDGRYTTDANGERVYEPRSNEELDQIAALVRSAVGFNADRGDTIEVVNMPFAEVEIPEMEETSMILGFEKSQILDTAEMVMLVVMGILVVLLVLRPLVSALIASQKASIEQAREEAALLAAQSAPAALTGPSSYGNNNDDDGSSGGGERSSARSDAESAMIDMQAVEGKVKASSVKKVGDIVNNHPNETVSVIRNWMSQE